MKLKEKECSKCPRCNKIYLDKQKICFNCKLPTEKAIYYSRLRIERFAFIYTLSLIISISLLFVGLKKVGPAYIVFLFLIVIPALLMFIYHMVNDLYGSVFKSIKKEDSIFKEIFFIDNKPYESDLGFSWTKYFRKLSKFSIALIILIFMAIGLRLTQKLLFSK